MVVSSELRVVGRTVPRTDGPAKVSGQTRYTADVILPGTIWGKVLRSPLPHARIVSIDVAAARRLPGVQAVLAARDLPDPGRLIGRRLRDVPILALDRVRYAGEPVAAVAAESADLAEQALALIEVEYDELPVVADPEAALKADAPVLHPNFASYAGLPEDRPADAPPNLHGFWSSERGDLAAGFAEAELTFEATYQTPAQHQGYLEPHSVLAQAQPDGSLDVWLSNKTPFVARKTIALALDLADEQVRVHPAAIGGDFGGKGSVMQAPLAALLSRASGRPVRLVLTYVEELLATNPRHSARIRMKVGARRDGTLTALEVDILLNGGAYGGMKPRPSLTVGGVTRVGGPYRIPNARIEARAVYTNTVPRGHMRAPGEPQVVFARELLLDELARALRIDPIELRRRNLLTEGEQRPTGGRWTHPSAGEVLTRAVAAIGWDRPREPNVGRGLAVSDRGVGAGHSGAIVRLELDGSVELTTAQPDTGTGAHTILQQLVAEALELQPSRVRIRIGGTDEAPEDSGAGGSRVSHIAGQAAYRAATEAAQQLCALASETFGWPEGAMVLRGGRVGPSASFEQEAVPMEQVLRRIGEALEVRTTYDNETRSPEQSFTVQAAEVEVDPETGQVRVRRFVTAHDVGMILNPQTHQGQIEGGLMQGLGLALMEELGIDPRDGRISTLSLGEYKLPNPSDAPRLETILVPGGHGPVPFDGKAIGEASVSAVAPAIAAAVLDAIGIAMRDLPITAEKVLAALGQRGS